MKLGLLEFLMSLSDDNKASYIYAIYKYVSYSSFSYGGVKMTKHSESKAFLSIINCFDYHISCLLHIVLPCIIEFYSTFAFA